jgi:hypothetical protein
MRTLSLQDARSWLARVNLNLDEYDRLEWPHDAHPGLYVVTAKSSMASSYLCGQSLDWLPVGRERLLLATKWDTYPPDKLIVFDAIRKGAGANEKLFREPGHLFPSTKSNDTCYDDRSEADVQNESIAMWLMGLMLEWTWEGLVAVEGCADVICLGDDFLHFLSIDQNRIEEARKLVEPWGLPVRTTFPWGGEKLPIVSRH